VVDTAGKQSAVAQSYGTQADAGAGGSVGKQTLVGASEAAEGAAGAESAAPGPELTKVKALIAAGNPAALVPVQQECMVAMKANAATPPTDARQALALARVWEMDRVAAIRDKYQPQIAAASTGAADGKDHTSTLDVVQKQMDTECTPFLDALMQGDPQYRYQHFDQTVQAKVFEAVRLHASMRAITGVGEAGHRASAETEARNLGNLHDPDASWCGVFAYAQQNQAGGMDPHWAAMMQGTGGIISALSYLATANPWIWAFDHWERLQSYHASRGSSRYYAKIQKGPPAAGIQPGDLVLIDNSFGMDPDHITTAVSFDGRFLTTVGGNQGSSSSTDEKGVSRSNGAWDLTQNPDPNDVRKVVDGKPVREKDPTKTKHVRITGIGRWSIVDYETHVYSTSGTMPTKPPSEAALKSVQ
jgi:hypothetical protein